LKWLWLRYKTGFNEWLSHIYYDEDITALINLIDFCDDSDISRKTQIVLDLMVLDMALNSFRGCFSSTHGRSYSAEKRSALNESTTDTQKLLFGMGIFSGKDNMSAVSLALSEKYRLPDVIYKIASDFSAEEMVNRQKAGIMIDEAEKWGLNLRNPDDVLILLSFEAYTHPRTFNPVLKLFDSYNWWENQFFSMFKKMKKLINFLRYSGLSYPVAHILKKDITRNTREEVDIYTYRTPDYMLSSALDYRKGYGGDQQHIWQATLSPDAVCFTTHPGHTEDTSGGFWVGSGTLPRVAQVKNVLIALYKISRTPGIYQSNELFYTHAWFPRDRFDRVVEKNGWIFGSKNDGYIALYSRNSYRWQSDGEFAGSEVISDGIKNIWICEMGRLAVNGEFEEFIDTICGASIFFKGLNIKYASPFQGEIEFGWRGPLINNGRNVNMHNHPRYENQYVQAQFPPERIEITHNNNSLSLDLKNNIRNATGYT